MKTILVIFVLALSLNAQTLATVNNQEIKVEDVNNFLKSTNQDMDYNKLDNKVKNLTLHQTIEKTLLIQEAQKENLDKTKEFKEMFKKVDLAIKKVGDEKLTPIFVELKKKYTFEDIRLVKVFL